MKNLVIRCSLIGFLVFVAIAGCGPAATPAPEPTATMPPTPLAETSDEILIVTGEYEPYTGEALEGGGFTTEIVRAVFAEMGVSLRVEFYPWPRCEAMVEKGEAWGTFPYTATEDRKATFSFSDDLVLGRAVWFTYGDAMADVQYNELGDLKAYRVGGSTGYWYIETLEQAGLTVDMANDDLSNLSKLRAGRIDLFPANEYVDWWLIQNNFPDDVDSFGTLDKPYDTNTMAMMVSQAYPNSQKLLDEFNAALARIQQNGTYQKIFEQYDMPFTMPEASNN